MFAECLAVGLAGVSRDMPVYSPAYAAYLFQPVGLAPLPPLGHICDVMLVWRKGNIEKLSLSCSIVYYYNGAQRYEQFLQVGQLYRALILLGLVLLSSERLCVFGLRGAMYTLKLFCLHLSPYLSVS